MKAYKKYTIVGINADTDERFWDTAIASSPDAAEDVIRSKFPDILIAGVFEGVIHTVDTKTYASE